MCKKGLRATCDAHVGMDDGRLRLQIMYVQTELSGRERERACDALPANYRDIMLPTLNTDK